MKKLLALLLSVMMVFSLITACSSSSDESDASEDTSSEESEEEDADSEEETTDDDETEDEHVLGDDGVYIQGVPVVDEEITISVCMERHSLDMSEDQNDKWAIKTASADTNVIIDWTELANGTADEKIPIMLAGGDLPDVFFDLLDSTDILQYEDSFYAIEGLFDTYAQNIYEAMSQIDNWEKMAYTPSGHVYSGFGFYQSLKENSMIGIQIINTQWLENVGLDMPTDWDSYYTVLEAFRDEDANGNGDSTDEIPYAWAEGNWSTDLWDNESGRFGIPTYNSSSYEYAGYVYVDEDGVVQKSRVGENYYTYLTVMHQMYVDGLIDAEGFSDTTDEMSAKVKNLRVGTYYSWTAITWLSTEEAENYTTMERFGYTGYEDNFYQNGVIDCTTAKQLVWVVTTDCEYPNAAVRYWDYLQSDQELTQAMALGEKGVLWDEYEDGSGYYFLVPDGTESMTFENMKYTYGFVNGCPLITAENTPVNDAEQSEAAALRDTMVDVVSEYAIPESQRIMPSYAPTEETEELSLYSTDLINYIDTYHGDAIVNGLDEASYEAYIEGLDTYNYDSYVEYYQHMYDSDWD